MINILSLSGFLSKDLMSVSLVDISGDEVWMGMGRIRLGEFDLVEGKEWVFFGEVEGGIISGGEQ
jgi:hypothetical protein